MRPQAPPPGRGRSGPVPAAGGPAEAGFTLIEALVALMLLVALTAVLVPLAGQLLRTWSAGSARAARTDAITAALGQLRRDTALARAYVSGSAETPQVLFSGSPGGFTLVTDSPDSPDGPAVVTIATVTRPDGVSLLRTSGPLANLEGGQARQTRVGLLSRPLGARFSYRDRTGARRTTWEARTSLPAAVGVTFLDGGQPVLGGEIPLWLHVSLPLDCVVRTPPPDALCGAPAPAAADPAAAGRPPTGAASGGTP